MKLATIFGVAASLTTSSVVQAAMLQDVQGGVKVSQGGGYVAVLGDAELKAGDMVMVDAKGKARLVYPDGCDMSVRSGAITVVPAVSPCAWTAQFPPNPAPEAGAGATGAEAGAAGGGLGGLSTGTLALGAAGVTAAVAAAVAIPVTSAAASARAQEERQRQMTQLIIMSISR